MILQKKKEKIRLKEIFYYILHGIHTGTGRLVLPGTPDVVLNPEE